MADSDVDVEADDGTLSDEASVYESCTDSNDNSDDDQDEESNDDDDDDDDDGDEQHEQTEDNDLDVSLNDDDDNPNSSQCPVCLMTLTGQQLGTPNNCDHVFCFLCISEWSKNSNTCPVDRTKFDEILVHTTKKGPVIKRVKVEDKKVLTDQDWEQAPTYCEICEQCNREAMMLLCDGCDRGYHMFCLTPRLYEVPAGDWYCDTCFVIRNETSLDEGVPVADLISSSSGISEATMPSNSDRASSTRGRGRSRRGTGSRTSTARRSRSSSTRSRRKSKRGRGRKRGSTRSASSSTRKRKGKTTKRKTTKRSIKKSPTKKRKTTENNVYQPSLFLGLRTGERLGKRGSSSNDRARPLGSRTALSIFGDEFALHDFEAEVDDAAKEKPFISPRRTNNSTDVLLSIMDGIEVLHDEDARVSRDGSVLPSESHDKTSPPKSSSNSPEKTKTTPQKEDTHQSPVEKVSPLKRPSSTSPVDNEYGFKVKKVSFAGISDGTVEEKSNDSNDIAGPSRDHPRGYSPDISQESKNSSLDHSPEQSREQQSRDHGHVAERSRDLSHDDLRKHLSELSRHRVHNPRDYSRDRSHISRDSGDFSFGHPRKYKSDNPMKDFSRDNSRHSRDTMDFKRKYKGNNSRSTRDLKDFSRDHSRDFSKGHSSGQPSRISPSLRGESPPLITCKQRESRKISSSSYHEHFHHSTATAAEQAANVGDVRQSRDGDLLRESPHFDIPRMSSSRSREVEISRPCLLSRLGDPCMSSASSTETSSSQSLSSRYNHSSDSPTESMMASRSDVMKPQTLSSRFSNQSPRVPMATISSSGDVNMRQTLSSRFGDPSVSPVVSTATATSSKPRLIEFKSKSNELVANVVPDRQKLPTLPSLASNSTLPTLPRLKSFKPSDSQSSSRPKLKGLSTSRDKKTLDGYPKPDSSYRQNLAIIDMLRAKKSTLKAEIKKDDVTPVTQARQTSTEGYSKLPPSFSQTELNHTHSDANFHRPKLSSLLCQSSRKSSLPVAIVRPRTADCESEVSLKAEAKRELGTSTGSAGISNVSSRGGASISSDDDERLHNRRKGIARLQRLTSIKDTVRLVLQPFYDHREISRTEFKDIFMRAVQKVNESSQDVNYLRIADLVKKYVKKYKGLRIQNGQIMTSE